MRILLKSKLYQQEISRIVLILALLIWAIMASFLALQNRKEIILIGLDQKGHAQLISDKDNHFAQEELKSFLQEFLESFFRYDENTFSQRISLATDLMSQELWTSQKDKLLQIAEQLKKEPLTQDFTVESMDMLDDSRVEAILRVTIKQRISEKSIRLRVNLGVKPKERTRTNPWGFEITELADVVL